MWRVILIFLVCLRCGAQSWVQAFGGTGTDFGSAVSVNSGADIFVAGSFTGTITIGNQVLTNAGGYDIFLAKFNLAGAFQWATRFGGTNSETVKSITLDSSGNIFLSGAFFVGSLAKFSSSGQFIWTTGPIVPDFFSIASDSQGNVVVTGDLTSLAGSQIDFGGGIMVGNQFGGTEAFLAKYSTSGACIWAKPFLNLGDSQFGTSIAVDKRTNPATGIPYDNILVTGYALTAINLGGGLLTNNAYGAFGFLGKFQTSGAYTWGRRCGTKLVSDSSGPFTRIEAMAIDGNGDAILAGEFAFHSNLGGEPVDSGNQTITGTSSFYDMLVVKYSGTNGAFQWDKAVTGNEVCSPNGATCDGQNNFIVTGSFNGTYNFGSNVLTAAGPTPTVNSDGFVAKYSGAGLPIWAQQFGGPLNGDAGTSVAVDIAGFVSVTGAFYGTATIAGQSFTSAGGSDAVLFRLNSGSITNPANWYVDSSRTGTSDNSGTSPQNAWTNWVPLGGTDGQWTGKAKGGDTIWVFPGVGYTGNRPGAPDGIVMFNISGLPNNPITFKAIQTAGLVVTPPFVVSGSFFTFDGRLSDTYTNLINFDNLSNLYQITNNINWWVKGFYGFGSNQQNGIYMPNSNYRCKFQWLHIDPKTFNTNNYPFGNNPNGVGSGTHGVSIVQNTGEHLDGGEIAYCYIEEADQCCISILNNNAPIWGGFRIHHNVLTKQGDAGARLAGGFEFDHNIVGTPQMIHGHPNGVVMVPSMSLFHHNIMLNSLDTMFYTPGGGTPTELGIKVYNNLFYTTWDWSFIYTNQYSSNLPFVNHSIGGMQFLVEANPNNVEPWLPTTYTNFLLFNNTVMAGIGSVSTNANAGINTIISLPNRFAPGNTLLFEPGLDRGFVNVINFVNLNNLFYNVSASGSGQTIGAWQGWVDRFNANTNTWTNNTLTSTAGILFDPRNASNANPNLGSSNVVVDYNNITADQAASESFGYNGPFSGSFFATAEAFNTAYTTNGYTHNTSAHPSLVNTNAYDFHPRVFDVVLVGNGTNLSSFTNTPGGLPQFNMDLSGVIRPATPSIGAYEPQMDLILHYTFDDLLPATGSVAIGISPFVTDITGYGSTMQYWGFVPTPTNWPARVPYTNSIGGSGYAAQFVSNLNPIPAYGNFTIAQFGGITNIGVFSNLSAITVSVWMKYFPNFGTNDNSCTIIDTQDGSPGNGATWSLGRNSAYQTSFDLFTNLNYNTQNSLHLNFPDNQSTDWHFYTATFNTTNQMMNIYLDGTNCGSRNLTGYSSATTNLIVGVPSTGGSYGGQNGWIAIGCRTHNGSPNLADSDLFPNNAWMDGQAHDLRVYNRELASGEVLALYNGGGASSIPAQPPGPQDPVITLNPLSQTVTAPATATFTANASSTNSLTFQWFKNGSAIAGATATTFTTPATSTADNGSTWFMQATAGGRNTQSTTAVLTVGAPGPQDPIITLNPVGQSVTAPATATFTSTASSTQSLTFQWSKNGSPIAGATQTSFTTPPTVLGDNGSTFFMVATAGGRTIQSSTVTLLVSAPGPQDPLISSSPISQSVTAPATATFTSSATSTQALTFQWYKSGVLIPGATSTTFTTSPTTTADNGSTWFMIATAGGRTDQSATATLTVFPQGPQDPIITLNPLSQFIIAPNLVTFTAAASSTNSITYQWYKNGLALPGATSTSYTTATAASDNGSTWFMIATAGGRAVQSATAILSVSPSANASFAAVTTLRAGNAKTGP